MQRLALLQHDVIRDIHDIVNGPNSTGFQPEAHPSRRRLNAQLIDDSGRITSAKTALLDFDAHALRDAWIFCRAAHAGRFEPPPGERGNFAGNPRDAETIPAVRRYADFK